MLAPKCAPGLRRTRHSLPTCFINKTLISLSA